MIHTRQKQEFYLIIALIVVGLYLSYLVYAPFIYDFLIAACCAAIFRPLYLYLEKRFNGHRNLSATLCTVLLTIIVIGPTTLLISALTAESLATYNLIKQQITSGNIQRLFDFNQYKWLADGIQYLGKYVDINSFDIKGPVADQVTKISLWIYQNGTDFLASVSLLFLHFFFIALMFYFLVRDTKPLMREIAKFSPFSFHNQQILSQKFTDVSQAILKGTFLTAFAQGFMLTVGFLILGLPGPLFWGFVTVFFALIPLVGTAIVWLPAGIILIIAGSPIKGILMLLWGALVVSTVDNLIRPYVMSDKAHLPAIIIFFAVIGGIGVFGPMGIIIAPMSSVLVLTLLEMYGHHLRHLESEEMKDDGMTSVHTDEVHVHVD